MVLITKVNGLLMKMKKMEWVSRYGPMDPDMTDFGVMEWQMVMVDWFMLKVMCMREIGLKTKQTDLGYIPTTMEVDMKDSGTKINNMAMVLNSGQMVPSTKEIIKPE